MMSVLVRERRGIFGHRETQRRPCEDRGRDCSEVATSPGMPGATQKPEAVITKGLPVGPLEGADIFILGFWPAEL